MTQLLQLSQLLRRSSSAVRLWLVTAGAQAVAGTVIGDAAAVAVGQSLWGFGRTLRREEPQLRSLLLDLDPAEPLATQIEQLLQELAAQPDDAEVAYREGERFTSRLEPQPLVPGRDLVRLELGAYGSLDALRYVPLTRQRPGPGEVEVQVHAVGLNLRDLLNSLGMLQDYYATVLGIRRPQDVGLGLECVGTVTAVGPGVTTVAVGERVMGMAGRSGTLASVTTLPVAALTRVPEGLSDVEAATLPLAYLTAWYALVERAGLQRGERVLIHAAAGGGGTGGRADCAAPWRGGLRHGEPREVGAVA